MGGGWHEAQKSWWLLALRQLGRSAGDEDRHAGCRECGWVGGDRRLTMAARRGPALSPDSTV